RSSASLRASSVRPANSSISGQYAKIIIDGFMPLNFESDRQLDTPPLRLKRVFEKFHRATREHKPRGSHIDHQFGRLHAIFVVFAEPAIAPEPSKTAFDNPGQPGDLEGALSAFDNLQFPTV